MNEPSAQLALKTADVRALLALERVNSFLPDNQELVSIAPTATVRDALDLMRKHNYSNLPIIHTRRVLGVFSYRSLVEGLSRLKATDLAFGDLTVDEFSESVPFVRVDDAIEGILGALERYDVVLVGDQYRLQAIATPVDLLLHLYRIASPYVLVQIIELALRELIRHSAGDQFTACVERSLKRLYGDDLPATAEDLTLSDFVELVTNGDNWHIFSEWAGKNRKMTRGRLLPVVDLRNTVMHFRREITAEDYDTLTGVRDWLLLKLRQFAHLGGLESDGP